jgi:hypothetical protein
MKLTHEKNDHCRNPIIQNVVSLFCKGLEFLVAGPERKILKKGHLHQTFSSKAAINRSESSVDGFFSSSKFKEIIQRIFHFPSGLFIFHWILL